MAGSDDSAWEYDPSLPAAALFVALWSLTVFPHIYQMFATRKWYMWTLIFGGAWELVGFIFRILSIKNPTSIGYAAPHQALIILAPIWIAAWDYMTLGRLIHVFLPTQRAFGLPARRITLLFVTGDIVSFLIQLVATNFLVGDDEPSAHDIKLGTNIIMGGLALQLLMFAFFIAVSVRFEVLYNRAFGRDGRSRWFALMKCLNVSCACIVLRSVYRIAEFASPYPGPLVTHEIAFYLLEALPMLPTLFLFNWWHPAKVMPGQEGSFRAEKKRLKMERKQKAAAESQGDVEMMGAREETRTT
ncbi:RTA1 like protein-domain-containing protein [Geopyxis carbonaria]|nr:RTA1 like protein-domain-containing protein [Geopyxis carbonaria]